MTTRETGTVKWFNETKGYGFIARDQGEDVFVHYRGIRRESYRTLQEGQRVNFYVTKDVKGLRANDVVLIDDSIIKEVDDFEW